jgi:HK97 family phage major capsid protein
MDKAKQLQELRSSLADTEKEMTGISDKMVTEKRNIKNAEERTKWDELSAKADSILAEISDVEKELKRSIAIAKAQGDVISAAAGAATPGKDELGVSDRKNVRKAKVTNWFRAANERLNYQLEGVEKELSDEAAREFKSFSNLPDFDASKGSLIPAKAMRYMSWSEEQFNAEHRDVTATGSALGVELINTETLASNYVQALRPQNVLMNAGVKVIQNDSGNNMVFPRENSLYTAAMATAENAASTESLTGTNFINPALTFSPKRGTGFVQVSNQLLLQAAWWEPFLREQIILGNATLMDVQGINGSGASGQARGILNTTVPSPVVGGANGANFSRSFITQFENNVGSAGANLNNCKFITPFTINAYGKRTEFSSGSGRYLVDQGPSWAWNNAATGKGGSTVIDQYQTFMSANVPSTLTKGTSSAICSAVIFGDVSKMVLHELWRYASDCRSLC